MRRELTAALVAIAPVSVLAIAAISGTGAAAGRAPQPVYQQPEQYYLALGDSIAYGYQPTKKPGIRPTAFHTGFVDVFAARLASSPRRSGSSTTGVPGNRP